MPIHNFTAFYPSPALFLGDDVDFQKALEGDFNKQMSQAVVHEKMNDFEVIICKDSKILLRVYQLEEPSYNNHIEGINRDVKTWNEYLEYLNAFYLILDSTLIEEMHLALFELYEISTRHASRVTYSNGKETGEGFGNEGATINHLNRWGMNRNYHSFRQKIEPPVFKAAVQKFEDALNTPLVTKKLATIAKGIAEHKIGNYENSIVFSWFICEKILNEIWKDYLEQKNHTAKSGEKRINSERKQFLSGRDMTASVISEVLELHDLITYDLYKNLGTIRKARNAIAHGEEQAFSHTDSHFALETTKKLILHRYSYDFHINTGFSIIGM